MVCVAALIRLDILSIIEEASIVKFGTAVVVGDALLVVVGDPFFVVEGRLVEEEEAVVEEGLACSKFKQVD